MWVAQIKKPSQRLDKLYSLECLGLRLSMTNVGLHRFRCHPYINIRISVENRLRPQLPE